MFAGPEDRQGLLRVERDGCYEMDSVKLVGRKNRFHIREPAFDAVLRTDLVEDTLVRIADRQRFHVRMMEIDGNKFFSKS
jgi:hypothetical protein